MARKRTRIETGTGNVFSDLGYADAKERRLRVELALEVNRLLKERGLTQARAAALLAVRQPHISDLARYPGLRWLNKWHVVPGVALAIGLWLVGSWPALVWGFFVSTTLLWHGTFTINSLSHMWGRRRYSTTDDSKNNPVLAIVTMGEGWHNNHHYYQRSVRQGFYWWEIDPTFYILKGMEALGLVWDLHAPPRDVRDSHPSEEQLAAAAKVVAESAAQI